MAKNTSVGIDIGNNQLKLVQLKKTSTGIKIEKFYIEDYGLTSKELESPAVRLQAVTRILAKLIQEIKPINVVFTISKYEENIRTLSMPLMTEKQLREALKLGGHEDYIPFDLKEMIWDVNISHFYRRKEELKTDGREKMEVVFAVAKKQVVNAYLDIAEKLKFSVDILESNSLANLNYSFFNMAFGKDKIWSKIDVGAETSSVNVMEGDTLKFGMNIPWGVNDIVEVTQTTLGLDWVAAKDFVAKMDFGSELATTDERAKRVYVALEGCIKDFLRQLNGAFSFFESKSAGKPVTEVLLSGGGAKLVNFAKFMSKKIGKTVKPDNEINKNLITYDKNQETALIAALPQLGTAIGAAIRNIFPVRININLLPLEIIIGRQIKSRRSLVVVAATCIFLVLLVGTSYKIKQRSDKMSLIAGVQEQLDSQGAEVKELMLKKKAVDRLGVLKDRYTSNTKKFKKWSDMIVELTTIVPDKLWFDYAEWNGVGFESSGNCKEDVVQLLSENGMQEDIKYFRNLKYNTDPASDGDTRFKAWIRPQKATTASLGAPATTSDSTPNTRTTRRR